MCHCTSQTLVILHDHPLTCQRWCPFPPVPKAAVKVVPLCSQSQGSGGALVNLVQQLGRPPSSLILPMHDPWCQKTHQLVLNMWIQCYHGKIFLARNYLPSFYSQWSLNVENIHLSIHRYFSPLNLEQNKTNKQQEYTHITHQKQQTSSKAAMTNQTKTTKKASIKMSTQFQRAGTNLSASTHLIYS